MRSTLRRIFLLAVLSIAAPGVSSAQGIAKTLDELRLLTRPGETVTLTDGSGTRARGRITTLSPTAIELVVNGQPRRWSEVDVVTVAQRHSDSLANGALWGLGVGVGLASLAVAAVGVDDGDAGYAAVAIAFYGGVGAGIGVGVDALIRRERVIFERPGGTKADWRVTPLIAPHVHGARVSVRF
jgi:hypothetical protein